MITVKDIANRCGVSTATVSKALNGYGDISSMTADRIRKVAQEMHYMPNAAARQLKTNISHSIGILFVDETNSGLTHEFFSQILNSVKDEAERLGYDITFISGNIGGRPASYLEHARYRKCDGVLIAAVDFESRSVKELVESEVPTITIDYSFNDRSSDMSDNVEGGYALANYLIHKGHRKIAFVHGENTSVTKKRLIGFYRACSENGVEIPEKYMITGKYHDPKLAGEATRKLMELPDRPTAIMYCDDYAYMGGLMELERMHLSVPKDVSCVGYDGISLANIIHPNLTTYYQDTDKIGRLSVQKLVESIEHNKTCEAEQINVAGHLIEGHSVRQI